MRIGVDLGGTKIEAVALSHGGEIAVRERVDTPSDDYQELISALVGLVERVEAAYGASGSIGIGTPGAVSPATGLMKNSNSQALNGKPLPIDLERAFGRPIRIANDADCLALSEASDGAGRGSRVVFAVILGTGVGGGLVVDGSLVVGPNAISGEWGHMAMPYVDDPGPACYCGRSGCVETFISGPSFSDRHEERSGVRLRPTEIATAAAAGDAEARRSLDEYVDFAAKSLGVVINIVDPDVIVLGGGLSNIDELYESVPALWDRYVFSDTVSTPLRKAEHGDSSGVRGAAWLWPKVG